MRFVKFLRIRMSFIARYVYTYEEFVLVTEATPVQQNDSDRTKTQIIKEQLKRTSKGGITIYKLTIVMYGV